LKWACPFIVIVISGCVSNAALAPKLVRPEEWLRSVFGSDALTNSLNFYDESNPWNYVPECAVAIKDTNVFFVKAEVTKKHGYKLRSYNLVISSCPELVEATNLLKTRLDMYEKNPEIAVKEREGFLDPPTYTLRQYGVSGELIKDWHNDFLDNYGKIISMGEHVMWAAEKCSAQ